MGKTTGAVSVMTTEVQVPIFPLRSQCSICKLYREDPDLFEEVTRRLLTGVEQKKIVAWLAKKGKRVTNKSLSRHYNRHMLPYFQEALEVERRLRAEFLALGHEGAATIASALARSLAMRALSIVNDIDFEKLAKDAKPDFLRELNNLARTIAQIDNHAADAQLKEKLVQLRALELDYKAGNLDRVAARWVLMRLKDRRQVALQVIELLDLPMPSQDMKQLPAPKDSKSDKRRSRTKGTRGKSTRRKR